MRVTKTLHLFLNADSTPLHSPSSAHPGIALITGCVRLMPIMAVARVPQCGRAGQALCQRTCTATVLQAVCEQGFCEQQRVRATRHSAQLRQARAGCPTTCTLCEQPIDPSAVRCTLFQAILLYLMWGGSRQQCKGNHVASGPEAHAACNNCTGWCNH